MTDINDKKEDSDKNMMDCSEEEDSAEQEVPVNAKICILGNLVDDESVLEAAKSFKVPVETSRDGSELFNSPINSTVFVVEEFSGPLFEKLKEMKHRILGPTALKELSQEHVKFPDNKRPMYSTAMKGVFVSFTGFRYKEELSRLMLMIHNMGGSVRQDILSKVTHVIANRCGGKKYQYAATFKIPIMSPEWVHNSWAMRTQVGFKSSVDGLAEHKLKAFHGARVCFLGFPEEERLHMADILLENGGISTDIQDPKCTHVIIDESTTTTVPPQVPPKAYIVKAEWFWASVQKERCVDENDHVFQEYVGRLTPVISVNSTPVSSIRARKRKRLRTYRLNSGSPGITSPKLEPLKRRSSITDATLLSCSGSFLDASPSTDLEDVESGSETPRKNLSARHQVFLELLQTESNYVGILNTIVSLFKAPLDEMVDGEDQLLNATELKIIFGNLPPIQHAHANMLEDLKHIAHNWTEEVSIGNVFQKYFADLVKAYPPFVNFFENTREMLRKCDQSKPRFHAFLKARQTRAECGRQSLQELLIRPVQRLPSISLLLNDILKHTTKNNPDYTALETALNSIREVMTHINEDKRKTEGQMVMFDIFNDIDNCPPDLVSSHRSFIFRCDVIELSDSHFSLSRRGDPLVFYVFSDVVEICKKRSKAFNSLKSPNGNLGKISNGKPYKHIKLIPLSQIRKVVDIKETEDCHKVFALMCFSTQDLKEKIYSFAITDDEVEKMSFLKTLCRQTANNACVTDAETFMASLGPDALQIDTSDVSLGTLGKAFKFASRTRLKVGRALSFNKTPSKLKRAMSTMMSPFGSTTNLTPATQLAQMRLASCTNINELANSPPPPQLVAPLSVQPTRRAKHSSLGVSSLRRL